jgi:hypothetical protein
MRKQVLFHYPFPSVKTDLSKGYDAMWHLLIGLDGDLKSASDLQYENDEDVDDGSIESRDKGAMNCRRKNQAARGQMRSHLIQDHGFKEDEIPFALRSQRMPKKGKTHTKSNKRQLRPTGRKSYAATYLRCLLQSGS